MIAVERGPFVWLAFDIGFLLIQLDSLCLFAQLGLSLLFLFLDFIVFGLDILGVSCDSRLVLLKCSDCLHVRPVGAHRETNQLYRQLRVRRCIRNR